MCLEKNISIYIYVHICVLYIAYEILYPIIVFGEGSVGGDGGDILSAYWTLLDVSGLSVCCRLDKRSIIISRVFTIG